MSEEIPDQLPPHDMAAEKAVLGCILLNPVKLGWVLEQFQGQAPFFDLKNKTIFEAMTQMFSDTVAIDVVTLSARLKETGNLDAVGGNPFLSALPDNVPSSDNLPHYCNVVWARYLARTGIQLSTTWRSRFIATEGLTESTLGEMEREIELLRHASESYLGQCPQNLSMPLDFEEDYLKQWFHPQAEEPGIPLPFEFPLRLRAHEFSLMTGDNGSGKSSMIGQMSIEAALRGCEVTVASMEVPPAVTLWIMARQLLGTGKLVNDEKGQRAACAALAFLQTHIRLYNFLGITDWRHLMDTFRFVQKQPSIIKEEDQPPHGSPKKLYVVDSVMRIGIQDDDYALQGVVAAEFANFTVTTGAHLVAIIHENKEGGGGARNLKERVRGSKQWTDNCHNVTGMRRNDKKAQKLADLEECLRCKEMNQAQFDKEKADLRNVWDSKFLLSKQRHPGSRQNGSKHLWFDPQSLQFMDKPGLAPMDYLPKSLARPPL